MPSNAALDEDKKESFFRRAKLRDTSETRLIDFLTENPSLALATDQNGVTALMMALQSQHINLARALMQCGADPNAKDNRGWTPMIHAIERGSFGDFGAVVDNLLSHGADINATDKTGRTALTHACGGISDDIHKIFVLLEKGADVNATGEQGWTALMSTSLRGNVDATRMLLDAGANVNAADQFGQTPLMLASHAGEREVVSLLRENCANPYMRDEQGNTASNYATARKLETQAVAEKIASLTQEQEASVSYG